MIPRLSFTVFSSTFSVILYKVPVIHGMRSVLLVDQQPFHTAQFFLFLLSRLKLLLG